VYAASIHFARWVILPRTDKLLFLSNYDGGWERYLEDFIARAHAGLTAIWSNTRADRHHEPASDLARRP
jgi:hypothetical protein